MSLVNKIKQLCHEKKISVQALERAAGLSNSQIRRCVVNFRLTMRRLFLSQAEFC